jgi:hypothetical protein
MTISRFKALRNDLIYRKKILQERIRPISGHRRSADRR